MGAEFGGSGNEIAYAAVRISRKGFLIAGWTDSSGNVTQVYLVRINSRGRKLWERNFGGAGNDTANAIVKATHKGFVLAGQTDSLGNATQVYLAGLNSRGFLAWARNYGGDGFESGNSILKAGETGWIVTGSTTSYGNESQVNLVGTNALGL